MDIPSLRAIHTGSSDEVTCSHGARLPVSRDTSHCSDTSLSISLSLSFTLLRVSLASFLIPEFTPPPSVRVKKCPVVMNSRISRAVVGYLESFSLSSPCFFVFFFSSKTIKCDSRARLRDTKKLRQKFWLKLYTSLVVNYYTQQKLKQSSVFNIYIYIYINDKINRSAVYFRFRVQKSLCVWVCEVTRAASPRRWKTIAEKKKYRRQRTHTIRSLCQTLHVYLHRALCLLCLKVLRTDGRE